MTVVKMGCALVVTVYWMIVLIKLLISAKEIGKLPNVIPREPMGLALRLIWIPIIFLWVITPWLTIHGNNHFLPIAMAWFEPLPFYHYLSVSFFGTTVAVLALISSIWCWREMGKSWRVGIDPNEKTALITSGPYSFVLHPIYSLSLLLMIGSVLVFPSPLVFVMGMIHILLLILEAIREERFMLAKYPEEYPQYQAQMGRFIPKWNR